MQPITAFHRSIEKLYDKRTALRTEIDRIERQKSPGFSSRIFHLWCEVDELDRQIGANYYWYATLQSDDPHLVPLRKHAAELAAAPMDE